MIYVNRDGWTRRGEQVFHFWADDEAEKRLTGRRLKTLRLIHALAEQIEQDSVTSGDVSLRSDGGPKD